MTRTTALRQEAYTGVTQWMVTRGVDSTAIVVRFVDPDWEKIPASLAAVGQKEGAREGSRLRAMARALSAWRRRVTSSVVL